MVGRVLVAFAAFFASSCMLLATKSEETVLARWDGGSVTAADARREARFVGADERKFRARTRVPERRTRADWIRRIALREICRERSGELLAADLEAADRAAREWVVSLRDERCHGFPSDVPSDETLLAGVDESQYRRPRRLRLSHVFLRAQTEAEMDEAVAKLAGWTRDVSNLAEFQRLATEHSESETAARSGRIGVVHEGWIPQEAEAILWEMDEGSVSPPISLRGGVHVFFVEEKIPESGPSRDRLLARLRARADEESRAACRARALREARADGLSGDDVEVLSEMALASGALDPEERRRVDDVRANVFVRALVGRLVEGALARPDERALRARYDAERESLRAPAEMELRVLETTIPEATDPLEFFDRVEDVGDDLRTGRIGWEEARRSLPDDTTLERWPSLDAWTLASRLGPRHFEAIRSLGAGEVSPTLRERRVLRVIGVVAATPRRSLRFDEVAERLRARILAERRKKLAAEVSARLLDDEGFEVTAAGERWIRGGEE